MYQKWRHGFKSFVFDNYFTSYAVNLNFKIQIIKWRYNNLEKTPQYPKDKLKCLETEVILAPKVNKQKFKLKEKVEK